MKNKHLFQITLLTLCALIFTASGLEAKRLDQANKNNSKKTTIQMWIMPNSPRPVKDLQAILSEFEKANPDIHVEITSIDWGAALTKLTTAAISGQGPDITQLGTTWVGVISATNALSDLSKKVPDLGGKEAFLPASWTTTGLAGSHKVTAIPWFVDARALYYRTDVFKKLNLTESDIATWDKFEKTLKKIKDARLKINDMPIKALGVPGKNDWNVLHNLTPWIWAWGGSLLNTNNTASAFQQDPSKNGVKFFVGLAQKGYIPSSCLELNTAQVAAEFNEGKYAMYFDTPAQVKLLSTPYEKGGAAGSIAAQNYGVALYPAGPKGRFTFIGGSNLSVFRTSKHQAEAWRVIQYLTSKEAQLKYADATGFLPARQDAFKDKSFTSNKKRAKFVEAVKYGKAYPCVSAWGPIEPIMMRHIGIIWDHAAGVYGKYDPKIVDEAFLKASKEVDILLSEK